MSESVFLPSLLMNWRTVPGDALRLAGCVNVMTEGSTLSIDLTHVSECDSAGLALLIDAERRCHFKKITCVLTGMTDSVKKLALFCGLESLLLQ